MRTCWIKKFKKIMVRISAAIFMAHIAGYCFDASASGETLLPALATRQADAQPDGGPMLETPDVEGDGGVNLFVTSREAAEGDQWIGRLTRFDACVDEDANIIVSRAWEFGGKLLATRDARRLKYWKGGGFVDLSGGLDDFKRLTGMTGANVAAPPGRALGAYEPHMALYDWFRGYEYSYFTSDMTLRGNMLSDFGQSAVAVVSDPTPNDSLPGFREWAESVPAGRPTLYAQTNDGVMHVIDPLDGDELAAILPPPVLMPARLASLKTTAAADGKFEWIDIKSEASVAGGQALKKSNPVRLLDGPLRKKYFDLKGHGNPGDWGAYIYGTTGRGGRGIFMYDVTERDEPKLMWYRENAPGGRGKILAMTGADDEPALRDADPAGEGAYLKLGLNSPEPRAGVIMPPAGSGAKMTSFIALSGGVQSRGFEPSQNGGEGAVLMLINPADGSVIRAFDGASIGVETRVGGSEIGYAPYMGMMTSPPSLARSQLDKYYTGQLFAADNRGNIFRVALEKRDAGGWVSALAPSEWKIETVATLQRRETASSGGDSYAIPGGVIPAICGGELWLAGCTSDVSAPGRDGEGDFVIRNAEQFIFAFAPRPENGMPPQYRESDWKVIDASPKGPSDPNFSLCPGDGKSGWYIRLRNDGERRERVSTNTVIADGVLYVGTFEEGSDAGDSGERGAPGISRLYALDLAAGAPGMWSGGRKYLEVAGVRMTGITESKRIGPRCVFVTYEKLSEENGLDDVREANVRRARGDGLDMLCVFPKGSDGARQANIQSGGGVMMYWQLHGGVDGGNLL